MSFKVSTQSIPLQRGLPWQPFKNNAPFPYDSIPLLCLIFLTALTLIWKYMALYMFPWSLFILRTRKQAL